jgi:hypothetical protein
VQLIMQQSTSCRMEDEWRYGNGTRQRWRMTAVGDDNDMRDWAVDCNGEGQQRVVREGRDSGVMMMAAAAEDGGRGHQQQRRQMTAVDDSSMQDWAANYKGKGQ